MTQEQIERLITAIEDLSYNLEELKGQFTVTNRMHTDSTANVLSEIAWALNKKFEDDFNNHLNK